MIALAERGTLYDPGPCMYMEKIAVGPNIPPDSVSLERTVAQNLQAVSDALGKPVRCAALRSRVTSRKTHNTTRSASPAQCISGLPRSTG